MRSAPPSDEDDPAARAGLLGAALDGYHASYVLTWNGARIGEARERFFADETADGGYRFERSERIVVRRGDAVSSARTIILIETDQALTARHILVDRTTGPAHVRAEGTRLSDQGWRITFGAEPARLVDGNAVPSTLVPLLVAGAGASAGVAFDGPVLVEGSWLAQAHLVVTLAGGADDGGATARADLQTAAGPLRSEARLDAHGFLAEAGLGAALASQRVDDARALAAEFDPPEIVDSSALAVAGAGADDVGAGGLHLYVANVKAPPPVVPELAEQLVSTGAGGAWDVSVDPTPVSTGSAAFREVKDRTGHVARALRDDLGLASLTPAEALAAGSGDCTAHAVVLQRDLEDRGYEARLVTGFLLDDGALRRHRWVLVKVNRRWVPVDPMYDEAPASPRHLALAVHGTSPDELAFVDDVVFAGWSDAVVAVR